MSAVPPGLARSLELMTDAGADEAARSVFAANYARLRAGEDGLIREASIAPLEPPARLADVAVADGEAAAALAATVLIRLNGGLGTSMGMSGPKSAVPVRGDRSFLRLIVEQVRHARRAGGARLPLLFMDSFRTRRGTLAALAAWPDLPVEGLPLDFLQNAEPKLLVEGLEPARWPADPALEWCPPGHGDLYPALLGSGLLEALLERGFRYAACANADNLGAAPDARLAGWFAATGAPYAAEVTARTPADRKGGHLARRVADGRLVLRDTAQTAPEEMSFFTDARRHPLVHTNNLWFDLERLHRALSERDGVLGLPLIRNEKHLDPTDPTSPRVVQLETAAGAAVEAFEGATAIEVPRSRFLPVKTTNDLLVMRSDCYDVGEDAVPRLAVPTAPTVDLDPTHYGTLAGLDAHFPDGPPGLRQAASLRVRGSWTFGAGVQVVGRVELADSGRPRRVPDGTMLS